MKNQSQPRSLWLVFASLVMAFLLAVSSVVSPQMITVSYAKYATEKDAGTLYLSIDHAHSILTDGYKLRQALATGTTTANAVTHESGITASTALTEVYFGTPTEYASQINGITGVDVSAKGDKSIMLYKNGTKAYIVSDRTIATGADFGSAFEKFSKLTKVHFSSDFDTTRTNSFAYLFYGCTSLASIENLSSFDTANATSMQSMFYASSPSLKSIDLSSFNTAKVTDMGSMFRGNTALTSIDVTGFDTSKVWDMGGMFEGCSSLTSIDVTNFDTSSAEIMTVMFQGCTGLKTLDLRSFSCESLTNMNSMFKGCSNLTTIYADYDFDCRGLSDPAATDTTDANGNYTIDSNFANVFTGCTKLVGGSGTKYDAKIVHNLRAVVDVQLAVEQIVFQSTVGYFTHYSGANEGSTFLKNGQDFNAAIKTLANGSTKAYTFADTAIKKIYFGKTGDYNVSGLPSTNVDAANKGTIKAYWNASTGTIYVLSDYTMVFSSSSDYMFDYLTSVTGIYFDNISTSAMRTMQRMFGFDSKLSDLDLSKFETHNVVDYGSCFRNCIFTTATAQNKIIPYLNTNKARDIGGLFMYCTGLTGALDLSSLSSAKAETIASLVEGCTGITSVNISGFTVAPGLTNTSSMFSGCSKLATIYTSPGFNLNIAQVTTHGGMFTGCTALKGSNGTAYSATYVDKTYARPDVSGTKGYFTSRSTFSLRNVALMTMSAPAEEPDSVVSSADISAPSESSSTDIEMDVSVSDTSSSTASDSTTSTAVEITTTANTAAATTTVASSRPVTSASDIPAQTTAAETTTTEAEATTAATAESTTAATTSATQQSEASTESTVSTTAETTAESAASTSATTTTTAAVTTTTTTTAAVTTTTTTTASVTTTTTTTAAVTTSKATTTTTTTTAAPAAVTEAQS